MLTPAIYRTTITHNRQTPVHHFFEYRSYSWYVDIDELPSLPWWLRAFARFDARDHLAGRPGGSLRERVDAYLADHDAALPGGRITALLQARVLGYVFNPFSVFWCHDHGGMLRRVIVEVHNTYGQARLPAAAGQYTGIGHQEVLRLAVQLGRRPLPGAGTAPGSPGRCAGVAARRRPAGLCRDTAGQQTNSHRRPRRQDPDPLAAGAAGGGASHPYPRHRVVVAPSPDDAPDDRTRRQAFSGNRFRHAGPRLFGYRPGRLPRQRRHCQTVAHRAAARLPLRLRYPDGTVIGAGDAALQHW